jgi:hypothetical protein
MLIVLIQVRSAPVLKAAGFSLQPMQGLWRSPEHDDPFFLLRFPLSSRQVLDPLKPQWPAHVESLRAAICTVQPS